MIDCRSKILKITTRAAVVSSALPRIHGMFPLLTKVSWNPTMHSMSNSLIKSLFYSADHRGRSSMKMESTIGNQNLLNVLLFSE